MKTHNILKFNIIMLIFISINTGNLYSQASLNKAKQLKANYDYANAIKAYSEHIKLNNAGIDDLRDLALCYIMVNDIKSAALWYKEIVSSAGHNADDLFKYANLLKSTGNYDEAIKQYELAGTSDPSMMPIAKKQINACNLAKQWMTDKPLFEIKNAENFNSDKSDFGLIPFGKGFMITSDRKIAGKKYNADEIHGWTGDPYLKIFYADFNDNNSQQTGFKIIEVLNNNFHNGPGSFDKQNNTLYFTRTKSVKVKKQNINSDPTSWYDKSNTGDYTNRLEIYSSNYNNGKWTNVKAFDFNNSENYSIGHPAVSPDGRYLYFVSDMPGGYGESDIYYTEKQADGKWGNPINAGSKINSPGKEVFPVFDNNGRFYFSSDYHPGMGGLDIFFTDYINGEWTYPENMKHPINSPMDDFLPYFTEAGKSGFLSSNREGGKGNDDIYSFALAPPKNMILAVIIKEKNELGETTLLDDVNIEITNLNIPTEKRMLTSINGLGIITSDCNKKYEIIASKEGYFTAIKVVETDCKSDTLKIEMILDKIIIDKPIVIENIYYDYNKWNIRADAAIELNKLVATLNLNPQISIELGSHTDSRGTTEYNNRLSQRRAESAVAYIVSMGISKDRITAKGYGETMLVNHCTDGIYCNEEQHQMNRRTEFKVTKINKPI